MTLDEFRILHSNIIEHYQFIEAHLEGIYAEISGNSFLKGLEHVEKYSIKRTINEIQKMERERNISVFTDEEYQQLEQILERRNFWCHNCYFDLPFDRKSGGLKKESDIKQLKQDMRHAEQLREMLFEKKLQTSG